MSLTPWLVQSGAPLLSPVNTVPGQRRGSVSQIPLAVNPPVMSAVPLRCSPDAKPEASGVRLYGRSSGTKGEAPAVDATADGLVRTARRAPCLWDVGNFGLLWGDR